MRATNDEKRWESSEKMATSEVGNGSRTPPVRDAAKSPRDPGTTTASQSDQDPPLTVRIREMAPPDPELLSQIGCRCLVIDLPGVLVENLTVKYRSGFVRVEGQRTVGRIKDFRKKFPLNHEQVVTRMLSAFLSQGVLVIVTPTKVAASMAAAAMVASQIKAKGYEFPPSPKPSKPQPLLLTQDPVETGEPVKFSSDLLVTAGTKTAAPQPKSAVGPYQIVSPSSSPPSSNATTSAIFATDKGNGIENSIESPDVVEPTAVRPRKFFFTTGLPRTLQKHPSDEISGHLHRFPSDERRIHNNNINDRSLVLEEPSKEMSGCSDSSGPAKSTKPRMDHEEKKTDDDSEKMVGVWSDTSLWDEPSDMLPRNTPRRRSVEEYDVILDEDRATTLSPIKEHQEHSFLLRDQLSLSPANSISTGTTSPGDNRPLTWLHFENVWQDNAENLIIRTNTDTSDLDRRRLHGMHGNPNGPQEQRGIMLPFEDELFDRDDRSLGMELEPHPYWRSAPFLPSPKLETIEYVADTSENSVPPRDAQKAPSPSLLRRNRLSGRKTVTWVDEI
ncbi:expressed unknown protein [Seminavis robusta]|uniref:SHSP domain-containing protein n=1 Tax=Seminavis robusta TaxID=568900 RepID=A0A9N8H1R0_9STRA|nr:expressed unknown protein [Seminavis robusta]|eukprot:Sro21_g014780.1 n/a (558) ;mRNA; r:96320-97993